MKMLVFDMDGTIADLYGIKNWLHMILTGNPAPYYNAKPKYDMQVLNDIIHRLKARGWRIAITTWLAKDVTEEYNKEVRKAKLEWLRKVNFPYDEIHLVKYGTTKADCTRKRGGYQILIDDNETIRKGWTLGRTIDAKKNILKELADLK